MKRPYRFKCAGGEVMFAAENFAEAMESFNEWLRQRSFSPPLQWVTATAPSGEVRRWEGHPTFKLVRDDTKMMRVEK